MTWDKHPGRAKRSWLSRLLEKIVFSERGCWLWQGAITGSGYGMIKVEQVRWDTHVFTYTQFIGPVPPDKELGHICLGPRNCVCPFHLKPMTHKENCQLRRMEDDLRRRYQISR
jgi:hypothetical protein